MPTKFINAHDSFMENINVYNARKSRGGISVQFNEELCSDF